MSFLDQPLATKDSAAFPGLPGSERYGAVKSTAACRSCKGRMAREDREARRQELYDLAARAKQTGRKEQYRNALTGEISAPKFTASPGGETERLALFANDLAAGHLRALLPDRMRRFDQATGREWDAPWAPWVRWFEPDGHRRGFAVASMGFIGLSTELRDLDLVRTVTHEVRHVGHLSTPLKDSAMAYGAEIDAEQYATTWAPPMYLAFRESRGDASRVRFTDRGLPPMRSRNGDLVITNDAKLWRYSPFTHTSWTHVRN